jgi:GAF domain-containing protein
MENDQQNIPIQMSRSNSPATNLHKIPVDDATVLREAQWKQQAFEALLAMAEILFSLDADPAGEQGRPTSIGIAQRLAELACTTLGCQGATISTLEPENDRQQLLTTFGFSPKEERRIRARMQEEPLNVSLGNPEFVVRLQVGEPLVIDLAHPAHYHNGPAPDTDAVLVVPMRPGTQLVGLIILNHSDRRHEYTPDEIALAMALGKFTILAIERERLLREREESQSGEQAIRAATQHIDAILSSASHELRTPLTSIKGNIQLARLRLSSVEREIPVENASLRSQLEEIKMMLERADRQTDTENRLISKLRDANKDDA